MSNAVQTTVTDAQSILDNVTAKGLQVMNSWIRDFPELMYVGLYLPNVYKDWGKLKRGGLTYMEQKALNFKSIGALETDMTINKNEVVWNEAQAFTDKAIITADNTADTTILVSEATAKYLAVGDVVVIKPWIGSVTTDQQRVITVITPNLWNPTVVTLDSAVTCLTDDYVMFAYNQIIHGTEITRGWVDSDYTPVKVYFQKFGWSMEFDSQEINQTRLFVDAQEYIKSKFAIVINRSNNAFAKAWYIGRNISGPKSETQGLNTLIEEKEAREGNLGTAIIDFTWVYAGKAKAKKLVEVINRMCSAPVYTWSEVPTFYCNYEFITNLSEIMYDMSNFFTLQEKTIDFGITEYSSPYFKNVKWIVSHTLNTLYPNASKAFGFPKHLVTFRTPEYQSVTDAGALVKTSGTGYTVLKMPQTSVDYVKYTAQMTIANIFAGQTYENTYVRIDNF